MDAKVLGVAERRGTEGGMMAIGFTGNKDSTLAAPRKRRRKKSLARGSTSVKEDREDVVDVTPEKLKDFFQRAGGRMCNIMVATNGWVVISRVDEKKPALCFVFTSWKDVSAHVKKIAGGGKGEH